MSLSHSPSGFDLLFNRDERRTRSRALPPEVRESAGTRVVSPTDPDGGGSWIAANEHGVVCCMLNSYRPGRTAEPGSGPESPFRSRGLLLSEISFEGSVERIARRLGSTDTGAYRPFILLAISPEGGATSWELDGGRLEARPLDLEAFPLSTSSHDPAGVLTARRDTWRATLSDASGSSSRVERLWTFHRSHRPRRGPESVCMHRDDARTVSATLVSVDADEVSMTYVDGPPCSSDPGGPIRLARTHRPGL